jgi:hypothetical protein
VLKISFYPRVLALYAVKIVNTVNVVMDWYWISCSAVKIVKRV